MASNVIAETYHTRQAEEVLAGARRPRGSDSHSCTQATNPATAMASINRGIACMQGGDTLRIGPGTYKELLMGSYSGSRTCTEADAARQHPCAILPNGLDQEHPTRLLGEGTAVITPDIAPSGGGSAITLFDTSRYFHFEGLRLLGSTVPGSASGIHLGNAQYVTVARNEIAGGVEQTGALITGSPQGQYFLLIGNNIHHAGQGCDAKHQGSPPCRHGIYLMGQHHAVVSNWVHHNSNYAVQISGEGGGISDVLVARNRVEYNWGVGIRLQGDRMQGIANQLVSNGTGMTLTGNGLVAHNTFDGYNPEYEDPFGLWTDGGYTIVNNVFTRMKSAWLIMQRRSGSSFVAVDPSWAHHNGCDLAGNVGCTLVHPTDTWYQDLASGDYRLATQSPAKGTGSPGTGVTADIQYATYQQPDLGAYAWQGTPPIPPEPPATGLVLACVGQVSAVPGQIQMTCTQQQEERR
jgi:hypothetical protein